MKCTSCGNELADQSQFCPYCGTKVDFTTAPVQQPETNAYNPDDYTRPNDYNAFNTDTPEGNSQFNQQVAPEKRKNENPVFGILAIIFSLLGGWLGLVFAIMGIAIYKDKKNKTLCFIAIGLQVFWFVVGFITGFTSALEMTE